MNLQSKLRGLENQIEEMQKRLEFKSSIERSFDSLQVAGVRFFNIFQDSKVKVKSKTGVCPSAWWAKIKFPARIIFPGKVPSQGGRAGQDEKECKS